MTRSQSSCGTDLSASKSRESLQLRWRFSTPLPEKSRDSLEAPRCATLRIFSGYFNLSGYFYFARLFSETLPKYPLKQA